MNFCLFQCAQQRFQDENTFQFDNEDGASLLLDDIGGDDIGGGMEMGFSYMDILGELKWIQLEPILNTI